MLLPRVAIAYGEEEDMSSQPDHAGTERLYAELEPSHALAQRKPCCFIVCCEKNFTSISHRVCPGTYTTHTWRVRLASSSLVVGEYTGPDAVFRAYGPGKSSIESLQAILDASKPLSEWGQWRERLNVLGIRIMAYDCVTDAAVRIAGHVVQRMLCNSPIEIVRRMAETGCCVGIIGRHQVTTDIPDHAFMKLSHGGRDIDATTRGLGGTRACPMTSCGEENLTMEDDKFYTSESILVHEFGHMVMNVGLSDAQLEEVNRLYEAAKLQGLYTRDIYAMENAEEYWAEGTQAWFDATVRCDVNDGINTRQRMKDHDPGLASMLQMAYGDGTWRYLHDAPTTFTSRGKPIAVGTLDTLRSSHVAPQHLEMERARPIVAVSPPRQATCEGGCLPCVGWDTIAYHKLNMQPSEGGCMAGYGRSAMRAFGGFVHRMGFANMHIHNVKMR
ncbi:VHL domain-containing protein [Haematococcus lacustris]|uniref:VHL domain-containing protein n=1 Tax=Haematococcus lacustris TaxID=44745 RepID=A0A6A0A4W6_HAELA|nr:VHL domain-containing protein [Haematococcus lacustris]